MEDDLLTEEELKSVEYMPTNDFILQAIEKDGFYYPLGKKYKIIKLDGGLYGIYPNDFNKSIVQADEVWLIAENLKSFLLKKHFKAKEHLACYGKFRYF